MRIQYQKGGNYFSAMGLSAQIKNFMTACMKLRFSQFKDLSHDEKVAFEGFLASIPMGILKESENG